jgi:hypothetical protein
MRKIMTPNQALSAVYHPEFNFLPEKFAQKSTKKMISSQVSKEERHFMDLLGSKLGLKNLDGWYNISAEDIEKNGGKWILKQYNFSAAQTVQAIYPEHNWMPWRFSRVPKGFWETFAQPSSLDLRKSFFRWIGETLNMKHLDDWYRVSHGQIYDLTSVSLGRKTLIDLLMATFPQHNWDETQFAEGSKPHRPSQRQVALAVHQLFPNHSTIILFSLQTKLSFLVAASFSFRYL